MSLAAITEAHKKAAKNPDSTRCQHNIWLGQMLGAGVVGTTTHRADIPYTCACCPSTATYLAACRRS